MELRGVQDARSARDFMGNPYYKSTFSKAFPQSR